LIGNVKEWDSLDHVKLVLENERRLKRAPLETAGITSLFDVAGILALDAA
jgi:hypothetical protein